MSRTVRIWIALALVLLPALLGSGQAAAAATPDTAVLAAIEARSKALNCLYGSDRPAAVCDGKVPMVVRTPAADPAALERRSEVMNCLYGSDRPAASCYEGSPGATAASSPGFDGGDFGIGIAVGAGALGLLAAALVALGRGRGRLARA